MDNARLTPIPTSGVLRGGTAALVAWHPRAFSGRREPPARAVSP